MRDRSRSVREPPSTGGFPRNASVLEALEPRLLLSGGDVPGDTLADALDTGLSGADATVFYDSYGIGAGDAGDVDLYEVTLDHWTDTLIVDLDTVGGLDTTVRIFDGQGNEVASNNDFDGTDSYLQWSPGNSAVPIRTWPGRIRGSATC